MVAIVKKWVVNGRFVCEEAVAYFSHFHTSSQHHYSLHSVLPHHPPKVFHYLLQWTFAHFHNEILTKCSCLTLCCNVPLSLAISLKNLISSVSVTTASNSLTSINEALM